MFNQYKFIERRHVAPLERAFREHTQIAPPAAAHMYQTALEGLAGKSNTDERLLASVLSNGTITSSTVTDARTGVWLMLARASANGSLLLTVGQKWIMEMPRPDNGMVSTVCW